MTLDLMKLSSAPQTLKEYILQCKQKKEIFDLKERHDIDTESPNKIPLLTIS